MNNDNISQEAKVWLEHELEKYKSDIISRIPFDSDNRVITVNDLIQAKYSLENYKSLYSDSIKKTIKKQRLLYYMVMACILTLLLTVAYYYIVVNNGTIGGLEKFTIIVMTITMFTLLFTITYSVIIGIRKNNMPDKKIMVDKFMYEWYMFENILKQKYSVKNSKNTISWLNVIQSYINDSKERKPQMVQDYYLILNIRNKIVHGKFNSLDNNELNNAIKIISRMIISLNNE